MNAFVAHYRSPIGWLRVTGTEQAVMSVAFVEDHQTCDGPGDPPQVVANCIRQLDEYFSGRRTRFSVPLHLEGTPFQLRVWDVVRSIPFGETHAYSSVASLAGRPDAVRAVGHAVGKNACALLLPCHRVTGKNAELRGYAWGTWRKEWLIRHEQRVLEAIAGRDGAKGGRPCCEL